MSIESLIRSHVVLGKRSNKGFEGVRCQCCNDYKERAGFSFEGGVIQYNCFNCNRKPRHEETQLTMFRKFREVLNAFGIFDNDIDNELNKVFFENGGKTPELAKRQSTTEATEQTFRCVEIEPPPGFYMIDQAEPDDIWATVAREYLAWRNMPVTHFGLSSNPTYRQRLIIPSYRFGKLVFWQSRAFDDEVKPRYINCETPKENALYGYDNLVSHSKSPLFVTEGIFDSRHVDGVSIFGSSLSDYHRYELGQVRRNRPVIFVIDKDATGISLGKKVVQEGYAITYLEGFIDDIDDSIRKMGKLWTLSNLMENIKEGFEAMLWFEMIESTFDQNDKHNKKGNDHEKADDPYGLCNLAALLAQGN